MITHIKTKGFKGSDIDEDIHPKTLYVGPNGSGKSTRTNAVDLILLGYIPSVKTKKKPADILDAYGAGNKLTVAVTIGDTEFEKYISRDTKGKTSLRYRIDKKKYSATDFAVELAQAGAPKLFDVSEFMSMSDQKKIEYVFDLFSSKEVMKNLEQRLDLKTNQLSSLEKKVRDNISVIQRLNASKKDIEVPVGTLAEVQAEIESLTQQVKDAQENLKQVEIDQARTEGEEKAVSNHVEKQETGQISTQDRLNQHMDQGGYIPPSPMPEKLRFSADPEESIRKIINVLNDAGCAACAALLVARAELKKFRKGVAA